MSILVIAAHPDDEVLGCGGTIRRHVEEGERVDILFICDGVGARGYTVESSEGEIRREAGCKAAEILGAQEPRFLDLPDNQLDTLPLLSVVKAIEEVLEELQPHTVYTHHSGDLNIDHSLINRAVLTACRPQPEEFVKNIYAFEVASSTEWSEPAHDAVFTPNHFVDIATCLDAKLGALEAYEFELRPFPHPRSKEAVMALAQWRGASAGLEAAEAFQVLRQIVG